MAQRDKFPGVRSFVANRRPQARAPRRMLGCHRAEFCRWKALPRANSAAAAAGVLRPF